MTKRLIANTFIELCKKYPVEKITVKMIVDTAHISKQTFYNHFKDKYDMIAWDFLNDLSPTINLDIAEYSLEQFRKSLEIMESKRNYYKKVFSSVEQNSLLSYHQDNMVRFISEMIKQHYRIDTLTTEMLIAVKFYSYGGTAVFVDWLKSDSQISPEELANAIYECMPTLIRETWKNKEYEVTYD